jgi:light-regulated signal transduction histidine kinase (bacteriophytochrome)
MDAYASSPTFGASALSNCERELIHLAGSIQPHGALLVLREPDLTVLQLSANVGALLGIEHAELLGRPVALLGGDLVDRLTSTARGGLLGLPVPLRCVLGASGTPRLFVGAVHRTSGGLILELEPATDVDGGDAAATLPHRLAVAVTEVSSAASTADLCETVVRHVRALTGYDRVMVYRFDPDGHGEVVAEARDPSCEPFLGLHYPASDIPQRARDLYVRNRVRVLVDRGYEPSPVVPRHSPVTGADLDMSLCYLRSMSPMHVQYLGNMGVTATLVASLVREGQLWGLIACHHYTPKRVGYELRAACELLAEVAATRVPLAEGQATAHTELLVRALERRLMHAMVDTGDWRDALFGAEPSPLLAPLGATGAALVYEGQVLCTGETPSASEVQALVRWVADQPGRRPVVHCASLARAHPRFAGLAACGLLAAELSRGQGEYLLWFRPEQLREVQWAGDPKKPTEVGGDPGDLSPRRSFAAWSQLVRHTAVPWSAVDVATAATIRLSVADMATQVRALRVLIAERQASQSRLAVEAASEPMVIADGRGCVLLVNRAFQALVKRPHPHFDSLADVAALFADPYRARALFSQLQRERQPWRGEMELPGVGGAAVPVAVRADVVPTPDGDVLGYVLIVTDLSARRQAERTRGRMERALLDASPLVPLAGPAAALARDFDALMAAVLANGSSAVMQIADAGGEGGVSPLLAELETATRRAAELTVQILNNAAEQAR